MDIDRPLKRVGVFAVLLIFALMVQVNYIQGTQAEKLKEHERNTRKYADVFTRDRGPILAGGETLAASEKRSKDKNAKYSRNYKEGLVFSPVTGFFASTGGKSGIELAYSSVLDGKDKKLTTQKWFDAFIGNPVKGATVVTTINPDAQRTAYSALKGSTSRRAAAVVIDVETGAIVVAASYPSYDPNQIAPQVKNGGKRLDQLDQDRANFKPLVNKALNETFPPGSAFKTVVAAAAMEADGLSTDSTVDTGALILPESGKPLPNSHEGGACAGSASLINAFAESCNTTFGKMAIKMGAVGLNKAAGKFGFGKKIEIEPDLFSAESDVPVKEPGGTPLGGDNLGRSGIGQANVRATPLQMAMVAAAVANEGKIMKPYLVKEVRSAQETGLYEAQPELYAKAMDAGIARQLKQMMAAVVSNGTAKNLQGRNIAGKTGTAETGIGNINSRWFVGYSPIQEPKYAFAVITEGTGSAATAAGPLAGQIMAAVNAK